MSVIVRNRNESPFEPLANAVKLEREIMSLAFRNFGLKDVHKFVNRKYNYGQIDTPKIHKYVMLMSDIKKDLRTAMDSILINLRIANRIRVISEADYHNRLDHQNKALFAIETIIVNIHKIVEVFNVDINYFKNVVELLYLEQRLIDKWIKADKKRYMG